jgi:uncharacterized protein (DUF433 family)
MQLPQGGKNRRTGSTANRPSQIVKTPGTCGGCARVQGTRIPVWGIERARRAGKSVMAIVRAFPSLHATDVRAAFEYSDGHPREIDAEIKCNEVA